MHICSVPPSSDPYLPGSQFQALTWSDKLLELLYISFQEPSSRSGLHILSLHEIPGEILTSLVPIVSIA